MAGYENIRDANDKRTPEERRELAKKAGKASGQARRRKADFRKTLNLLLTAEIDNEEWNGKRCWLGMRTGAAIL